jgi:hypothetical protein
MIEIGAEKNTTIIFPFPNDMVTTFSELLRQTVAAETVKRP